MTQIKEALQDFNPWWKEAFKVEFKRRAIYDILNKLIEKGFVTYTVEKGIRSYQLTSPNNLKEAINKICEIITKETNLNL